MLRELSAIGLSQYTGQQAAAKLISDIMAEGNLKGRHYHQDGRIFVELPYDMGPFQLVLRGERRGEHELLVDMVTPALREKRAYILTDPELFFGERDLLYLEGTEAETLETLTLSLTEIARCFSEPELIKQRPWIQTSCYGISTEGKVLLGMERSEEDKETIREEKEKRRRLLKEAKEGSLYARAAIQADEIGGDYEVVERMKDEDVYSIMDGFYYPSEKDDNCFTLLGDILGYDKLMNPRTEEWVYYLDLDVLGQTLRVLINPRDLVGVPAVGRRFQGKVRFYGRLDPARLILENHEAFF